MFLTGEILAVDDVVYLMLFRTHRLEADDIVRRSSARGEGIEFRGLREEQSRLTHEFIAEFTPGEMLAC